MIASSPLDKDRAGLSVSVDGNLAFVGAHSVDGSNPGRVLAFTRSTSGSWDEAQSLESPASVNGDSFGYGVAVEGTRVLVGARTENSKGAAYEYLWSPATTQSRNGGANPASLTAQSLPVQGSTLMLDLDLAGTTGHSLGGIVAYGSGLSLPLSGGQFLLVNVTDPSGELFGQPLLPGPVASWNLPVPTDISFCGIGISVQGIHFGGVQPFALSNAIDLVVGA
ncbi:MAG: hypothetical protein ACI8QS_003499 [Planctomycetota bacterium]